MYKETFLTKKLRMYVPSWPGRELERTMFYKPKGARTPFVISLLNFTVKFRLLFVRLFTEVMKFYITEDCYMWWDVLSSFLVVVLKCALDLVINRMHYKKGETNIHGQSFLVIGDVNFKPKAINWFNSKLGGKSYLCKRFLAQHIRNLIKSWLKLLIIFNFILSFI